MAFRKKLYYPENQIQRNLFTRGGELMTLDDWKEYEGFYHKYTTGEVFTEKDWNPLRSKALVKLKKRDESYFRYIDLKHYVIINGDKKQIIGGGGSQFSRYTAPRAVKVLPSEIEQEDGVMTRYFIYKRNEPTRVFFEVDESQIQNFNTDHTGINQYLYGFLEIPWKISGPEFDIRSNGILTKPGIVDTNLRIIDRYSKKFPILKQILNNPREHSKYDK